MEDSKEIMKQVNQAIEMVINDENLIPNIAKVVKKLYDELLEIGFTEGQAILIASNYKAGGSG